MPTSTLGNKALREKTRPTVMKNFGINETEANALMDGIDAVTEAMAQATIRGDISVGRGVQWTQYLSAGSAMILTGDENVPNDLRGDDFMIGHFGYTAEEARTVNAAFNAFIAVVLGEIEDGTLTEEQGNALIQRAHENLHYLRGQAAPADEVLH